MKKFITLLLAAAMLVSIFMIPASAASVNQGIDVGYVNPKKAPKQDGIIAKNEYGTRNALYSYKPGSGDDQVILEHDEYGDWGFDFYACWDENNLYMAWVVNSAVHAGLPVAVRDDTGSEGGLGQMWKYSCVQFILTGGAPKAGVTNYQTAQWSGDYLESGVTILDDGTPDKINWSVFGGGDGLSPDDWDAAAVRYDDKNQTVYEVRVPWEKSGVYSVGNNQQFGLTYAVAAQEHYDNVKKGMLEWQDAILGGKQADNAGVITLVGKGDNAVQDIRKELKPGEVPANADAQLILDSIDKFIDAEASTLITDAAKQEEYNTKYTTALLLAPIEGEKDTFYVVENKSGNGELVFETSDVSGMIVASFHSDGTGTGAARKTAAAELIVGTRVHLFGVDLAKKERTYSNAMIYTVAGEENYLGNTGDPVESVDPVESSAPVESVDPVESSDPVESVDPVESSEPAAESDPASESAAESAAPSEPSDNTDNSLPVGAIIGIIAGVIVIICAVVFIVLKKKNK